MTLRAQLAGRLAFPLGFNLGRSKLWPGDQVHDGISFDAGTGRVIVKAPGAAAQIGSLTSLFTFTGGNQSMYRGPSGLLVQSVTNTPRIEYDANGSVLGLLMEAARTNLCLQSQDLTTTWADVNTVVITANSTTAPDGTSTADTITDNGAASIKGKQQTFVVANDSLDHTGSVFILKTSGGTSTTSKISLLLTGGTPVSTNIYFNTDTGVVGSGTAIVENYGLYWRVAAKVTNNTTGNTALAFQYYPAVDTFGSYTDNIAAQGSSVLWGFQLEKASFASSYIPTTTVSVARTADSCIRTLGSEFSATAGTAIVGYDVIDVAGSTPVPAQFDNGTAANRTLFYLDTILSNMLVQDAGVTQANPTQARPANRTFIKQAMAWATNDFAFSSAGSAPTTDALGTIPAMTSLRLGGNISGVDNLNGHIRTFDYYPSRLTNAQLQALSA
jgi:hypothetical protein